MPISPFEKAFIFFSHLVATDVQDIRLLRAGSDQIYLKNSFLFYNFVKHSWSCWLSLICKFKNVLLTYSQLGFAGFSFSIYSSLRQFFAKCCPTLGVLNKYRVLNNTLNAKNTQYSVAFKLHFIMSYYTFITMFRKLKNVTHCRRMSVTVPGEIKPSMVISLLSLLFPLTFGKVILMSSVAPFNGFWFRNPESRIHRV